MSDDQWAGMEVVPKKIPAWLPERMPEDTDAERSFIATVCAPGANRACVDAILESSAEDFVHPAYRAILQAAKSVVHKELPIDSLTLKAELETMGQLNVVGSFTGLVEILMADEVERPEVLLGIIKEKARLRALIHTGSKMIRMATEHGDYASIVSEASEAVTRLAMDHPGKQIITDLSDLLDDLAEGKQITTENGGRAMSWGDPILDDKCPIPRGEPTLVVARFGVGKTSFAVQAAVATVESGFGNPLFLSCEMGKPKIKARFAAHLSGINSRHFRDGDYDGSAIQRVLSRKEVLSRMKVMFPNQQCGVEEIESLVRHAVEIHGCDCVILDQFSHVAPPKTAAKENYAIANAMLSQRLTAIAKNLNLGWMTLAQLSRDGDDTRKPGKRDLAATDQLGRDAAVILGLWNKGTDENQDLWITIVKNRDDGYTGWARQVQADHGTCSFRVMEHETNAFTHEKRRGRA